MDRHSLLLVAMASFVGSHFLLSHPWRRALVARLGERGFLLAYSLVAFATFGWVIAAARSAGDGPLWWLAPDWAWRVAAVAMLLAAVLLAGSLVGNPAMPDPAGGRAPPAEARGVYAITRHPMMWSFALWAAAHAAVWGSPRNLILTGGIALLALAGAALQDRKKALLIGDDWRDWQARTAFVPFAAQLGRRARWRAAVPRWPVLLAGLTLWLVATALHPPLGGPAVGIWRG